MNKRSGNLLVWLNSGVTAAPLIRRDSLRSTACSKRRTMRQLPLPSFQSPHHHRQQLAISPPDTKVCSPAVAVFMLLLDALVPFLCATACTHPTPSQYLVCRSSAPWQSAKLVTAL